MYFPISIAILKARDFYFITLFHIPYFHFSDEKRGMATKNSAYDFRGGSSILGKTIIVGIVSIYKCRTKDRTSDTSNNSTNRTLNQDLNQTRKVSEPRAIFTFHIGRYIQ